MMKRRHTESQSGDYRQQKGGTSGYFGDFKLISRVRQYLKAHNHKNVNTYVMAEDLQRQYGEYARKKKNAFYRMVDKAYNHIDHSKMSDNTNRLEEQHLKKRRAASPSCSESGDDVIEDIEGDSVESFSPENEEYVAYQDFNSMNNMMSSMYRNMPSSSHASTAPVLMTTSREDKSVNDNCITIDDSSDSDTNVDNEMKKENTSFFIDRSGEGNKNKSNRSVKVNSNDSDLLISCSTPVLGTVSEHQDRLPIFDSSTSQSYRADKINPHKRKNKMVSVPESDKKKFSVSTMHHGKQISVQRESRNTDNISILLDKTENGVSEKISSSKLPKEKSQKNKKGKKESHIETTKKGPEVQSSSITFRDVGGNDKSLLEICKLLVHMRHPEVYKQLGMTPPRGFLLHGPPGCGKTLLAHAIAGELDLPFIKIAATEVVSGVSGESEEKIRDLFDKAVMAAPCILFIDEIDAITPKRETASKDMERRIVAQILSCMDDLACKVDVHVLVIGATNRPDSMDPALRRAGRFDKEITLGIPDEPARARILQVLCRTLTLSKDFDFQYLARNTPGYVGADLNALSREAAINAVNRVFCDLQNKKLEIDTRQMGKQIDQGSMGNIEDFFNKNSEKHSTGKDTDIRVCGDEPHVVSEKDTEVKHIEGNIVETKRTNCQKVSDIDITNVDMKSIDTEGKTENENQDTKIEEEKCTIQDGNRKDESKDKPITLLSELQTVLGWLKEEAPLTEAQLQSLCITMDDFKEALNFVQPSAMREGFATVPDVTWDNIGALHSVREDLQLAILAPVRHAEEFLSLGLTRAQGILLAGPPGCGKTLLAKAIANESGINFISVKGPELLNMYVGESERAVRQVFQRARNSTPCVIFFDELDSLCPRRSNSGEGGASVRVVNQMLTEMDGLEERKQVFIMGATNRPDIIDPAILRPGRLDRCLFVGMPSADDRLDILKTITKRGTKPKLSEDICLEQVANDTRCQGFTGADLAALVREASVSALKSVISCKETKQASLEVTKQHFDDAFGKVKPSVTKKEQERFEKLSNSAKVYPKSSDAST